MSEVSGEGVVMDKTKAELETATVSLHPIDSSMQQCPICEGHFRLESDGAFPDHGCKIVIPKIPTAMLPPKVRAAEISRANTQRLVNNIIYEATRAAATCQHPALARAVDLYHQDIANRIEEVKKES